MFEEKEGAESGVTRKMITVELIGGVDKVGATDVWPELPIKAPISEN